MDTATTLSPELCPQCQVKLVHEGSQKPWCERCLYHLDKFEPDPYLGPLGRRIDMVFKYLGFDLNDRLFREISASPVRRPELTSASLILITVSAMLLAALVAAMAGGVWLIVDGPALLKVAGVILILLGVLLRPRLGRLKPIRAEYDEVTRSEAPQLFTLLDQTAQAMGTPVPDRVFLGPEWSAFVQTVGLRRKRVLVIGVPLWVSARPQERVFLLGHELGHFINRDVRRGLLTQPACTMFGNLADLVVPAPTSDVSLIGMLTRWLMTPFQWAACYLLWWMHLGMVLISARDAQRAEYFADALVVKVAGTQAATIFDLFNDSFRTVVGSRARGGQGFAGWRKSVEETRAEQVARINRLRQLSLRRAASPFSSHPPYGMRLMMISTAAYQEPMVVLTESQAALIDAELARFEDRYGRVIAHSW